MKVLLVVLVVVAVVAAAIWLAKRVRQPEDTASHSDEGRTATGERFYSDTDRPAGPDAEDPVQPPIPDPPGR